MLHQLALNFRYAFRPRKPILTARLAKAVLKSYLWGCPPLRYVDFAIGFACNLRCQHCFATALRQQGRRTMAVADYARVARECMDLGTVNFSFQGGEPLLFKNLSDIIRACRPDRNVISVTTNGTLLTAERLAELKAWGVDILTISIDSAIAAEHDSFRGQEGAFGQTMAGLHRALKTGMRVTLGTVITHDTLRSEGILQLLAFAKKKQILLYLILPVGAGKWNGNQDILLDQDDLAYIETRVAESPYIRTDFQANFGPRGCGAAKEILYLTPYGDVLPCPFLHISFGNVLEEPVAVIRARMLQYPYFATYHDKCLVSTDQEFIDLYLSRTKVAPLLPIRAEEVFGSYRWEGRS